MQQKHSELEYKFPAECVEPHAFIGWCMSKGPESYLHVISPDVYYTQGDNVLRHRWLGGAGELTVKQRKSKDSTWNRLEINLHFANDTTLDDVTKFLLASGWKKCLSLIKEAHIFFFELVGKPKVSVVTYDVGRKKEGVDGLVENYRFIEVEIENGNISTQEAKAYLDEWRREITKWFKIKPPLNLSLFEIYTGKRYSMVKHDKKNV